LTSITLPLGFTQSGNLGLAGPVGIALQAAYEDAINGGEGRYTRPDSSSVLWTKQ
jgi:hypothetical protein